MMYMASCIEHEAVLSRMLKRPHRFVRRRAMWRPAAYCVRRSAAGGTTIVYDLDFSTNKQSQDIVPANYGGVNEKVESTGSFWSADHASR